MENEGSFPLVLWPISCFDRRREKPFPVFNRWYWLDWNKLTFEQASAILAIIEAKKERKSSHSPVEFDESIITMSIGPTSCGNEMLQYRHLFEEIPDNDLEAFFNVGDRKQRGFECVSLAIEYFEDETGKPISSYEMIQHVSGQEFPIIVRDPQSVVKLGPVDPINTSTWTVEKANTIAQFLDVVRRIHASAWFRSPHSITSVASKSGGKELLEAIFPDDEDTMSVLAYMRQLHAGDRLLSKACEIYVAHVSDDRKVWWVNDIKRAFEASVDAQPAPFVTNGATRRQIVRMFMYGAGLLHSTSNHGDEEALASFMSHHGTHQSIMIFNSCLMDFYRDAAVLHPVIQQDFDYWIRVSGLAPPSRITIPDLFQGFKSLPRGVA